MMASTTKKVRALSNMTVRASPSVMGEAAVATAAVAPPASPNSRQPNQKIRPVVINVNRRDGSRVASSEAPNILIDNASAAK